MLLKLARPAVLGPRIQTLRLPYRCAQPGDECQVAGWGTTATRRGKSWGPEACILGNTWRARTSGSEGGGNWGHGFPGPGRLGAGNGFTYCFLPLVKYNKGLSCSRVTVLSPKECEVFYPGVVTNNMMCAGLDQGQDPCQVGTGQGGCLTHGSQDKEVMRNQKAPSLSPTAAQHHPMSNTIPSLPQCHPHV